MLNRFGFVLSLAVVGAVGGVSSVGRAVNLSDIYAAALDQPQINAMVTIGSNTTPQMATTESFDFETGEFTTIKTFTIPAYFDTGASGILFSTPTSLQFGIPATATIYSDVGVGGTSDFQVSPDLKIALAHFYPRNDLDQFADAGQTIPITSMYQPLPAPNTSVRAQVGPYEPLVENPITDELAILLGELSAVDVIGMPAMKGLVVVIDPKPVNNFGQLLELDFENATEIPDVFMRTFVYSPNTLFNPATQNTDPGIPNTSHRVKLSYGTFDRFTQVTPLGADGPTLERNPFIGVDPVAVLEGKPTDGTPGIKITRQTAGGQTLTSEGNWLLDTGAAASMISREQAEAIGVKYRDGTYKSDAPILEDEEGNVLPNQFQLTIGGIGGQFTAAGFFLDSALLRTMEGNPLDDNDPNHINFLNAAVLIADITVADPLTGETLTLDGIFGMNFLTASVNLSQGDGFPEITDMATGYFDWITFDETNGILGLDLSPQFLPVPEPASVGLLGVGMVGLLMRRRRR
jgi:hypothetical protein